MLFQQIRNAQREVIDAENRVYELMDEFDEVAYDIEERLED